MALLDKISAPLTAKAAEHLLRRTMFGATRTDIAALTGKTIDQALDMLLAAQTAPPVPVNPISGQTWINNTVRDSNDNLRIGDMKAWWLGLMATQPISITEKMTLFWHNHFVSAWTVVNDSRYMYKQHTLLRSSALGNFKTLVRAISVDPAMLVYLNGNRNTKRAPQENYARELQELFTIGKGPEISAGNYTTYTEDDVRAAARVLTGWTVDGMTVMNGFDPSLHDATHKQFSAAYQNTVIEGRENMTKDKNEELDELINMIFRQNATSEYICRKLYRFFVNFEVTPTVEREVIVPLGKTLRDNNFEIKPVLRQLLGSQHFFDANLIGCMMKTPLDLVIGLVRQMQINFPKPTTRIQTSYYYDFFSNLNRLAATLQMEVLELPNVAGWPAYYQEPLYDKIWINSATMPSRGNLGNTLINGWTANEYQMNNNVREVVSSTRVTFDSVVFLEQFPNPEDVAIVMNNLTEHFFAIDLTTDQKGRLISELLPGLPDTEDSEWRKEWNDYKRTPTDTAKKNAIQKRLNELIKYMIKLAEYQMM
jgi:uncharacterized protein (DUF1800 family)